jgi:hypothetical protein
MFLPVLGLGVLAARGLDILMDEEVRQTGTFRRYLIALMAFPVLLALLLMAEIAGKGFWLTTFYEMLAQPTRFEHGSNLVMQRWNNLVGETGLAVMLSGLYGLAVHIFARKRTAVQWLPLVLLVLYCADVGRVNAKFMLLQDVPEKAKGVKTPVMEYLAKDSRKYRTLPLNGTDPMQYASNGIPVMFTSNAVQQVRWQNFLDAFNLGSSMPDMLNVKYLVCGTEQYAKDKALLGGKYSPVSNSPDGAEILLENRLVLPKGWLVPTAAVLTDPGQTLGIIRDPRFDPRQVALVETPPPIPLADPNASGTGNVGDVSITRYESNHVSVIARTGRNALLVLGEKYFRGWKATVDGKAAEIHPVNHILRGVYLAPGSHTVEFVFDPLPFKIGKWITMASFAFFAAMLGREVWRRRHEERGVRSEE